MSCGSGSGALNPGVAEEIAAKELAAAGVISSNRNFDGRLNAGVRGTFLASPPLVVAYAIAGSILRDLTREAIGLDAEGREVFLADLWPKDSEIRDVLDRSLTEDLFRGVYSAPVDPGPGWRDIPFSDGPLYAWREASMFVRRPPFTDSGDESPAGSAASIAGARVLLMLGDDVTTDHISPGSAIPADTEAGRYLTAHGVSPQKFGTYIGRRANHEVMIRGTFANPRLRNEFVPGREGGFTRHMPSGETMTVFRAAERYRDESVPAIVVAGRNYGCGSSRDWAAKGTRMLGVRAVIAESFERIHRSNLVGMGVLPLQFPVGVSRKSLRLSGEETFDIPDLEAALRPGGVVRIRVNRAAGDSETIELISRVDTEREAEWVRSGGVLPYVLKELAA
jgi:aconitate hydratase